MFPDNQLKNLFHCGVLLVCFLSPHFATMFAQEASSHSETARLSVIVSDPSGARIPNADVSFQGRRTLNAKTSEDGSLQVDLPRGSYVVTAARAGFKTKKVPALSLDAPNPPALNIVLELGQYCDDCCDDCPGKVHTTISDLPSVIDESVGTVRPLPIRSGFVTVSPPSVYLQSFGACSADKPCTRSEEFHVATVPKGCCILGVTNGDGKGANLVKSYEVFLNGKRLVLAGLAISRAEVKLRRQNSLKVVLVGEPSSKILIQFAYDPR